jgi:hypothetical protein
MSGAQWETVVPAQAGMTTPFQSVIPAQAGISGRKGTDLLAEIPAVAGAAAWGRHRG